MRILVTGADGFLGSHLCEALRDAGHAVTGLALYNGFDTFGWLDEVDGVEKVMGDIRDAEQMRRLIAHDIVFHLAAQISVPYSYHAARQTIDTNVIGTLNILEALNGARLVHTSTSEVYGTALYTPQDSKHPLQAQSPYAASKIAADKLVESYVAARGVDAVTLRPFNTYGPRQLERAVIPTIVRQALDPKVREIELGDTTVTRDFSYVADTVTAFMKAAASPPGLYTAGSGRQVAILAVVGMVKEIVGTDKPVVKGDGRFRPLNSEVRVLEAKADFVAETPLQDGLRKTVEWWRQRW